MGILHDDSSVFPRSEVVNRFRILLTSLVRIKVVGCVRIHVLQINFVLQMQSTHAVFVDHMNLSLCGNVVCRYFESNF